MSSCSKPSCANRATVVLGYNYGKRLVVLEDPEGEPSPHSYALCLGCAEGMRPPRGWTLDDLRSRPVLFIEGPGPSDSVLLH
jgi:hypothetical protein